LSLTRTQFIRPHQLGYKSRNKGEIIRSKPTRVSPDTKEARYKDMFYQTGVDPLNHVMNPSMLSAFMTEMAKINGRHTTMLTMKSQRRITKAIRRGKMMGIIPQLSRSPYALVSKGRRQNDHTQGPKY
jgi:small subunit ribosomal protein S18